MALELFTEQGYEKTSLREIAERLNVTKAALYYHFKSKDDIVNSFVEDRVRGMDELIEWAEQQPVSPATRREILARYADQFFTDTAPCVMRFFEQNQTVLKNLTAGQQMRDRLTRIADAISRGDASAQAQLRGALALFAVHTSWFAVRAPEIDQAERRRLALEVGYELLDGIGADRAVLDGVEADRTAG